jgi:hypothetical protein
MHGANKAAAATDCRIVFTKKLPFPGMRRGALMRFA